MDGQWHIARASAPGLMEVHTGWYRSDRSGPLDGVSLLWPGMTGCRAMATLVDDLVPDGLWAIVEPLLPAPPRPPYGGGPPGHPRPGLLRRDRLYGPHLHPLAAAARPRAWLRLTGDLLAAPDRVGQRRRVRSAPLGGAGSAW